MTPVTLATEDALSEAIAEKLVAELDGKMQIAQKLGRTGFGYLRSRIGSFCEMAKFQKVIVITDLDRQQCSEALVREWLGQRTRPPQMLLRVAVRTIESWVLADHEAMRSLLQKAKLPLPAAPDALIDPKATLIDLARRGPREVREGVVPERGSMSRQGLGYNQILVPHVLERWDAVRASERSNSLDRARKRIRELADAVA